LILQLIKGSMICLLPCLVAGLSHAQKAVQPKKAAATAQMVAKPAKMTLTSVSPRRLHLGVEQSMYDEAAN
jgi:ABC-type tungstate transport system substrate-binding protein